MENVITFFFFGMGLLKLINAGTNGFPCHQVLVCSPLFTKGYGGAPGDI